MGHGKLKKFSENETFACLLQPSSEEIILNKSEKGLQIQPHPIKGHWNDKMFAKQQPIILELGCGKGEYTIDLALRNPNFNYIGVDIKGARLWKGAKYANEHKLPNVAFLRTRIEFIEAFFAPNEVAEIWLTFSDPQMKSENSRLTSPIFLNHYRKFLRQSGILHLKTDSAFLHNYSKAVALQNHLKILASTDDLYGTDKKCCNELASVCGQDAVDALYQVRTFYEKMFIRQGYKITYLSFLLDHNGDYNYPEFDADYWRSIEGPRKTIGQI